jgi:flagellar motility protein MotE (MotC chaperone)
MKFFGLRLRLLPATILMLTILIPVQLDVISRGVDSLFVQSAAKAAEPTKAAEPEGKKAPADDKSAAKTDAKPSQAASKEKDKEVGKDSAKEGEKESAKESGDGASADHFDPTSMSASEMEMLQSLSQRRGEIEAKEKTINERILLLEATEKRVNSKIEELANVQKQIEALKTEIQQISASYKKEEDEKVQSLVRIYETMKPKEAAVIFDQLDNTILIQVLSKMKEAKSAIIMANMNPVKARVVTALLLEHKKLPELPE